MRKGLGRTFYYIVYWLFLGLVIQGTVSNVAAVEQPDIKDITPVSTGVETSLQLSVSMPEEAVIFGEHAHFVIDVRNESAQTIPGVELHLPGLDDVGDWQVNGRSLPNHTIQIGDIAAYTTHRIELSAQVQALSPHPVPLQFEIETENTQSAETSINLITVPPTAETLDIVESTTLSFAQERLQVDMHDSSGDKQANEITFQLQEQHSLRARESGVIIAFQLFEETSLTQEENSSTLQLTIGDLVTSEHLTSDRLGLYGRQMGAESWTKINMTINVDEGTTTFDQGGFSEFMLVEDPEPWKPTFTPPGTSEFSGAGQYSYSFNLPPGVGGLAPSLGLSYNSRGVDSMRKPIMSQGFGAGWSLPSAEIVNGNAASWYDVANDGSGVCDSFDPTAYTLYLNGASYPLEYIDTTPNMSRHGEYTAVGDPSLRIRQEVHNSEIDPNNNHNVTGEYWEVATGDGTVYLFGFNEHAEQVIGPLKGLDCEANAAQPRNHQEFAATSWKLEQVTNVYGETIYYEYGTKCGIYDGCRRYNLNSNTIPESNIGNNGIYIFPDSGAQPAGKFRTEVDVALSTIRYNDAQNTEILFSYEEQNSSLIHAVGNAVGDTIFFMKVGFFRPDHLVVQHEGNVVSAYHFDYDSEKHVRHDNDNNSTDFWWLTGITAYGADYDIVTQTGTSLPPPEFFYDKDNKNGCGLNDIDEKEQEWVCVPFLTRVESGYGAVSKLKYTDIINEQETDWYIVTQVETWDGIEYIYSGEGIGNKAQSRIVYDRTGFVRCHDREGHGCDNPSDEESDALVGFSGVAIEVQKYESSISGWVTLSKQMKTFDVGEVEVYWLNGKTLTSSTYDSNDLKLTEQTFNWDWIEEPDVNENVTIYFARLNWRSNINYDPNGGNQKIGTCETYTYDKNSQGGKQWGRRTNTTYYHSQNITSSCGDTGWQEHHSMATYYATSHPNPHLILPWAIGLVGSQNEPLQLTLNYYDGATYPDAQTLTHGELTLSRSVLLNESEPNGNGLKFPTVDTTFAYDGYGNVISTTTYSDYGMVGYANANGTNWNYVVSPTGPRTTEMAYSSDGLTVTWVEDALDHRTNFTYEDLDIPWLMTKITDPNLLDTHFEYDPFGRLFAVYDDDDDRGEEWGVKGDGDPLKLYHYEDTGWSGDPFEPALNWTPNNPNGLLIVEETRPFHYPDDGSGPYSLAQYTYYDGLGRPVHTRNREAEVNGAIVRQDLVTFTTYNAQGLVDCASMSFGLIEGLSGWSDYYDCHAISEGIKTGYDALGRTKVVTAPDGSETQYFYGVSDDFTPGIVHNRMSVVDANGYAISQGLNAWGQLVYAQEFTGTSYPYTLYAQTDYEYDLMGHLIKVTDDAGNETEMTYDALGRKLTMDDPDMGLWGYDYNPAGNLIEQTDAKASTICFLYDDLERLTTKVDATTAGVCPTTIPSWPSSDVLSRYYYDGTNAIGNLSAVTAADFDAQWDAFDYGSDGLLMGQRRVVNGRKYTLDYLEYDSLDRPTRIQYPNDEIVDVTYDHEGENSLGIEGGSLIGTDVRYNARSQMTYLGRGNSVATTYSYFGVNPDPGANPGDSNYRLKTIQHGSTFDSLPDFTYSYDIVGNILSRSYLSYQEGFGYDHLNRLMDVIAINDIMIDYEHVYTYDELGNIVERDTTKYEQLAAGPHAVTHVDNEQVFGYDANGNMITRTLGIDNYTQVFDIQNRLIEVVDNNTGDSTRFAYDASGQRVMTTRPDGSILYTPFPQFEEEVRPDYEGTGTDELIIGETGQVLVTNSWQTLTFNHNYRHPVVIAQPAERNETDSAVVRIFAVNDGSFRIRIHDAPGSPSGHVAELVNYIVVEAGHWRLADGTELEAGDQVTNATVGRLLTNSWADVTFERSFNSTPVVLSQVRSISDPSWVQTRQQKTVTTTGFQVALEQEEAKTTPHGIETIGWLAITPASGSWNGFAYEANNTLDEVTHSTSPWYAIKFDQSYSTPAFMATLASYDGSDNAHLRYDNLVSSSVGVMVEEDMTYDSEMAHTTEVVSYLVVENGATLTALGSEVERVNYALAGQTIAVQVTTTPPMTTTDGLHYIHSDHLGSASAMSDANGAYVTDSLARYKPFGEYSLEPDTNPDVTDMGFTGHKHNDDLGLIYMNARFYVPGIGRFASADTIVPDPNNPQQFNRYSYVLNNPLKLTDPSGHCAEGYMGDDYEDTGCLELAQLASQLIGTTNVLYKDEIESLYNFDWQSEEEVYAFVEQYNDLLDTLEWVAPRLNFLDTLGPTPEQHDRALDKLNDFFDGTATEATGHVFFIHFAQEFDKMGIDPEWNLTLSKSAQNAGEFVGSFGESLTKITVQVAGIELPILIAASLREGSRGAVFLVLLFNEISYETALPPLNN